MELTSGQIVTSRKGRDVQKLYVVHGQAAGRVFLCNGSTWTLSHPKKKNPLHIQPTSIVLNPQQMASDLAIKMALKEYDEGRRAQEKGG